LDIPWPYDRLVYISSDEKERLAETTSSPGTHVVTFLRTIAHPMPFLATIDTTNNRRSTSAFSSATLPIQLPSMGCGHSARPWPFWLQLKQTGMRSSTRNPASARRSRFSSGVEATWPLVALVSRFREDIYRVRRFLGPSWKDTRYFFPVSPWRSRIVFC
jgi:hypothetical protein